VIGGLDRKQQRAAYLFIAVPVGLLILFTLAPVVYAIFTSFTNYDIINPSKWVGLSNYTKMWKDPFFRLALKNTLVYTALYIPPGLLVALGTALLLNRKRHFVSTFRVFFYLPVVASTVASATIWYWLLNPQEGLLNTVLRWFGVNGPAWLYDPNWAMVAIVIMSVWAGFGTNMLIMLGGLQSIPRELYEAARIDGASRYQSLRHVTVPGLQRPIFLVTALLIIGALQVFDQAYILTQGGPGNATLTIVYYIYNDGFLDLHMGYASAMSVVLFLIILVISLANSKITNRDLTAAHKP
jgi:multiple sugar transport system permease protein